MHGRIIGGDGKAVKTIDNDARWFYQKAGIKEIVKVVTSSGEGSKTSKLYVPLFKGNEPGNDKIMAVINLKS